MESHLIKKCKHPKILVVDDDAFNIHAAKELFLLQGYPIDFALNGEQAIRKVLEKH